MKVCIFLSMVLVVLQAPKRHTAFSLKLNGVIFMCVVSSLELQVFLSCKKSILALLIPNLTSA